MRAAVAARPGPRPRSCSTATTSRPTATSPRASPRECGLTAALDRRRPADGRHRRAGGRGRRRADRAGRRSATSPTARPGWPTPAPSPGSPTTPGALVLWDLCHSGGSVPVGSTPGVPTSPSAAPTSTSTADPARRRSSTSPARHLDDADPADPGLDGCDRPVPDGADLHAGGRASGGSSPARRRSSGCSPLRDMLALVDEAGIDAVREKSVALTSYAVELADELLAPLGVEVASPRDPERRGGHVTLRHPDARSVTAALWRRDVIPDYRDPGRPADRAVAAVDVLRRGGRRCRGGGRGAAPPGVGGPRRRAGRAPGGGGCGEPVRWGLPPDHQELR